MTNANKLKNELAANPVNSVEYEDIKKILQKYEVIGKPLEDILDNYLIREELVEYYYDSSLMPYGIMKARTGDPDQWVADRVEELKLTDWE